MSRSPSAAVPSARRHALRGACLALSCSGLVLSVAALWMLLGPSGAAGMAWAPPVLALAGLSGSGLVLLRLRGLAGLGEVVGIAESEARLKLVTRATSDAIYDWDHETGELWWGDGFYDRFGYDRASYRPSIEAWVEALHPDDVEGVESSLSGALAGDASSWEERYRMRRADGSYAEVIDRGFLMRDATGRVVRMVGGVLDITERLRDEADLRLLRRAMESADNGVLIIDARTDGMPVAYVNPAFERISGYSAEELVGCTIGRDDCCCAGSELSVLDGVRRAIAEPQAGRIMLRGRRRDGSPFWQELHVSPVRDRGLEPSHWVAIVSDVSERERVQQQLAYRASHDELTGLPNRQVLLQRLAGLIERAPETGRAPSVLFVDLDHFKLINDTMGHAVGDRVLVQVAERIRAAIPHAEAISRFGGDEFVAVLRESGGDTAADAAKRVMAQLTRPLEGLGTLHYLTPSIGYATWPQGGENAEDLLKHADLAMYQAKKRGRNSMIPYSPSMNDEALEKLHLVARLREALERDEFVVHFQPQFDARDGVPIGLEALIRWNHPERGLLPPGAFIDVAEDSGLIIQIGRWVLHETARFHRALAEHGWGHVAIAVNVSATQFLRGELLAEVGSILAVHDIPPGAIELELTESVVLENPDAAIATMEALRELGVALSIDDFGTGYSSLGYLRQLPADKLKLDRAFVADLGRDHKATAICATVIKLAQSIGLRVVAEGVETVEQYQWLRRHGCDEVQGYLFSKPLPFEEALVVLERGRIDPSMRIIEAA